MDPAIGAAIFLINLIFFGVWLVNVGGWIKRGCPVPPLVHKTAAMVGAITILLGLGLLAFGVVGPGGLATYALAPPVLTYVFWLWFTGGWDFSSD